MAPNTEKKPNLKRKRGREEGPDSKIQGKLYHGAREVRKAAKKAKTFETQKIVKKLKGLRAKNPSGSEITDLESQLEILKEIDTEPFGNTALKTKLKKERTLAQNEYVLAAISDQLEVNSVTPAEPGSLIAKVHAHILSSKVLAAEVAAVVQNIKNVLNPPTKSDQSDDEEDEEDSEIPSRPRKVVKKPSTSRDGDAVGLPSDVSVSGDQLEENLEAVNQDDDHIDDDGWESGSVDGGVESDENGDESEGGDSSEGEVVSRPSKGTKVQSSQATKTGKPTTTSSNSTFLPSLSVGFTRGDSDASDVDEVEVNAADGGPRKNRRGQRARRAIWEKKFGRNANHVKKQQEQESKVPPKGRKSQGRPNQSSDRRRPHGPIPSGSNLIEVTQKRTTPADKTRKEDKPLHPSWEAKRRLKEKQNVGIVPSQGKKITFD